MSPRVRLYVTIGSIEFIYGLYCWYDTGNPAYAFLWAVVTGIMYAVAVYRADTEWFIRRAVERRIREEGPRDDR